MYKIENSNSTYLTKDEGPIINKFQALTNKVNINSQYQKRKQTENPFTKSFYDYTLLYQ